MNTVIDFTSKLEIKQASTLKLFADILDRAFRYIIMKPHISQVSIVGFVSDRLARFIASCPEKYRERLIHAATETIPSRVAQYTKKG